MSTPRIVTPKNTPRSLVELYRHYSGDEYAREDEIQAAWETGASPLRRQILSLALKGYNEYQIARALGKDRASIQTWIERACEDAAKRIYAGGVKGKMSASKARVLGLMR